MRIKKNIFFMWTLLFIILGAIKIISCRQFNGSSDNKTPGINSKINLNYLGYQLSNENDFYGAKNNQFQDIVNDVQANFVSLYNNVNAKNPILLTDVQKDLIVDVYDNSNKLVTNLKLPTKNFQNYTVSLKTKVKNPFFYNQTTKPIKIILTQVDIQKFEKTLKYFANKKIKNLPGKIKEQIALDYANIDPNKSNQEIINIENDDKIKIVSVNTNRNDNNYDFNLNYKISIAKNDRYLFANNNFSLNVNDDCRFYLQNLELNQVKFAKNGADLYNQVYQLIDKKYGLEDYENDSNLKIKIYYLNKQQQKKLILNEIRQPIFYFQRLKVEITVLKNDIFFHPTNKKLYFKLTKIDLSKIEIGQMSNNVATFNDVWHHVCTKIANYFNQKTNTVILIAKKIENNSNFKFSFFDSTLNKLVTNWKDNINENDHYQINLNLKANNKYFINHWRNYMLSSFQLNAFKPNKFNFQDLSLCLTKTDLDKKIYQILVNTYNENIRLATNRITIDQLRKDPKIQLDLAKIKDVNLKIKKEYQFHLTILDHDLYFQKLNLTKNFAINKLRNLSQAVFQYPQKNNFAKLKDFIIPTLRILANQYNRVTNTEKISSAILEEDSNLDVYFTYNDQKTHLDINKAIDHKQILQIHLQINDQDLYFGSNDKIVATLKFAHRINSSILKTFITNLSNADIYYLNKQVLTTKIVTYLNSLHIFNNVITNSGLVGNNTFDLKVKCLFQTSKNTRKDYDISLIIKNNSYFLNKSYVGWQSLKVNLVKLNWNKFADSLFFSQTVKYNDIADHTSNDPTYGDLRDVYLIPKIVALYNKQFPNLPKDRQLTYTKLKNDKNISFLCWYLSKKGIRKYDPWKIGWSKTIVIGWFTFTGSILVNDPYFFASSYLLLFSGQIINR